jgi:hypothetical protein
VSSGVGFVHREGHGSARPAGRRSTKLDGVKDKSLVLMVSFGRGGTAWGRGVVALRQVLAPMRLSAMVEQAQKVKADKDVASDSDGDIEEGQQEQRARGR